jgi:LysM repeat protein
MDLKRMLSLSHRLSRLALSVLFAVAMLGAPALLRAQDDPPATHTVRVGETLSEIAAAYGVTTAELMALNNITNPNQIRIGQELVLPDSAIRIGRPTIAVPTHTVGAGETLSQIARQYDLSLARLMYLNGISDADAIYVGQILRLPVAVATAEATPDAAETLAAEPSPTVEEPTPTVAAAATPIPDETPTPDEEPRPSTHLVRAGETLSEIAQQYGVSLQQLMVINGIQNADAIYSGQQLRIPGAPTPTPAPTEMPTEMPTETPTLVETATPLPTATPVAEPPEEGAVDDLDESTAVETGPTQETADVQEVSIASLNRTYTVRRNDTIARIARGLGVDVEALRRVNRLRSNSDLTVGQDLIVPATADDLRVPHPNPEPGQEYIVKPGDSLSVIAKEFGLSLADVMAANYIGNPNTIYVGQRLVIPDAPDETGETPTEAPTVGPARSGFYYYTVQPGDTLSDLARQFDSTMLALSEYNDLPNTETVYRGLELRIPYGPPPQPVRQPPVPTSGTRFLVSLSRQECWLFWGNEVHRRWRCSTGYGEFITRTGNFAVQSKIENAKSNAYRLDMPYWLGIYYVGNYENGIHGLPISWATGEKIWTSLIGQPATFGCAMLADDDAAELFNLAYIGMPVYIIN